MQTVSADRGLTGQLALFRPRVSPADVDVHAVSIPARGFTGDFYYTYRDGETLWFALGDVAGKGINAAVVMAMIQEELEHRIGSCAAASCDPSTTIARLHEFLRPILPRNKFATVVMGNLHDNGTLTLVNAGHVPPLVLRRDGTVQEIGSTGPVAGILPVARWDSVRMTLGRGESLVLYSDGLAEAPNATGDEFGIERIRASAAGDSARAIGERILNDAMKFTGGKRSDDLTLVILRR